MRLWPYQPATGHSVGRGCLLLHRVARGESPRGAWPLSSGRRRRPAGAVPEGCAAVVREWRRIPSSGG